MKLHFLTRIVLASLLVLSISVFSFAPTVFAAGSGKAAGPRTPSSPAGAGNSAAACLKCHGPFDKLASTPPSFVAPSGEKINPHLFVPHDLKEIPDCVSCHKPHSANPTAAELGAMPKPNVKTCFECHHKQDFANCKTCHARD